MTSINGVKVGYTDKGNPYQKSSTGKNVGLATGGTAVGLVMASKVPSWTDAKKVCIEPPHTGYLVKAFPKSERVISIMKDFVMNPNKLTHRAYGGNIARLGKKIAKSLSDGKLRDLGILIKRSGILKSKLGRLAVLVACTALPVLTTMGIGKIYDKVIEHGRKTQSDNFATA